MPRDNYSDRRKDVKKAADKTTKPKMVTCPSCGKKFSASNQGGATVGGGTAAAGGGGG